jgi:hypothetical protein
VVVVDLHIGVMARIEAEAGEGEGAVAADEEHELSVEMIELDDTLEPKEDPVWVCALRWPKLDRHGVGAFWLCSG